MSKSDAFTHFYTESNKNKYFASIIKEKCKKNIKLMR